jgi:FkbM family methyltransferase
MQLHHAYIKCIIKITWISEKLLFESKLRSALRQTLVTKKPLQIFDVGANHGQSIRIFNKIFTDPRIHAFEPSEEVFKRLSENCKDMKNVELYNFGLGETMGYLTFYESNLDLTSTFAYPDTKSSYFKIKKAILFVREKNMFRSKLVQIKTLDSFIEEQKINVVDLLKIDVEGFELQVLKGAKKSLGTGKILNVQLERHEDNMRTSQSGEIFQMLTEHGFRRTFSIKHSLGSFFEDIWVKS